mgnify:CR=1 FL=1
MAVDMELVMKIRADIAQAMAELKKFQRETKITANNAEMYGQTVGGAQAYIADRTKDLDKALEKNKYAFQGWAMSIMFAGMALERTFKGIAKFGIQSFDDVAHSTEGMTTANDQLNGSMKYLGFVIGDALQPVIEYMIPIVEAIGEWVDVNPEAGDAFKSFKEGKLGTAITKAVSSGLMGIGGIAMASGSALAGGALITMGVAFELVSEGTFWSTIGKLLVVLVSLFETAFTWIGHLFEKLVMNVMADRINSMADMLKFLPGFTEMAKLLKQVGEGMKDASANIDINPVTIFKDAYTKNLNTLTPITNALDKGLSTIIDFLNDPNSLNKTSISDSTVTNNYNLVVEKIEANNQWTEEQRQSFYALINSIKQKNGQ